MALALINPTLACADRMYLGRDVDTLTELGAELFHIDIMDGHYVPNLCFDFDTILAIKQHSSVPLDIHLMVDQPFDYLERAAALQPRYISYHLNATPFPLRMADQIKARNIKAGVVLNPIDRVDSLGHLLPLLDMVQLMGVEPGFAGQRFIESTVTKVKQLNKLRQEKNLSFLISVDGGINGKTGKECAINGADILIAGALAIFGQDVPLRQAYFNFRAAVG